MKQIISTIFALLLLCTIKAQDVFITKGKIEYEKKINLHKTLDGMSDGEDRAWLETFKKVTPQMYTAYFDLSFNDDKTLYKPGRDVTPPQRVNDWLVGPANENIVYSDLDKHQNIALKKVYDNTFLIDDSIRNINWRITMDTRTIAGFECRKAVGIIMDSVYVIAFYTDQIIPSGGPESFTGLPGMILGIAIPRLNTTWFATKLELIDVKPENLVAPKKGKKISNKDLQVQLKEAMKDWGKNGARNAWLSGL